MTESYDEVYWDNRFSVGRHWNGHPNATLVAAVEGLTPGRALDVGAGEGGDASWLARNGWSVTALDISRNALRLANDHAIEAGVASRITWVHRDLSVPGLPVGVFELVTAHYIHLPPSQRDVLFHAMADAVAPAGTLVIVGHHPSDLGTVPRPPEPELFYLGEDITALLGDGWRILANEARPRTIMHPEDQREVTIHDTIVVAQRLA